jgi:Ca-activated chloride channel family protein
MNRRSAVLMLLGCLASAPAFAGVWSNLWRTPDQQDEALLAAGRPAQAAARFTSRRRKAYADLLAGRYAPAAQLLQPLKDPTSEYNLGNALAHLGRLHAALAAYDAALKQRPHDRDIRHNRNLVARVLAHRPPQQSSAQHRPSGSQSPPHKRNGGQQGARAGQGNRQEQSRRPHGASQGQAAPKSGHGANAGSSHPSASNGRTRSAATTHPASATGSAPHTAGQTLRNAERAAALARAQQRQGAGHAASGRLHHGPHGTEHALRAHGSRTAPPPTPPSEKALALKQWLRQIPNDPAGLLRRKFLIEYLLRHPGANP